MVDSLSGRDLLQLSEEADHRGLEGQDVVALVKVSFDRDALTDVNLLDGDGELDGSGLVVGDDDRDGDGVAFVDLGDLVEVFVLALGNFTLEVAGTIFGAHGREGDLDSVGVE